MTAKVKFITVIIFALALVFAAAFFALPVGEYAEAEIFPSGGFEEEGTNADPYLLENAADFAYLEREVNGGNDFGGKYFKVAPTVIDFNNNPVMIGYVKVTETEASGTTVEERRFNGTIDGQNAVLENIAFTVNTYEGINSYGLFGYLGASGKISNLTIHNVSLSYNCAENGSNYFGGLAGINEGWIENCNVNNLNVVSANSVGGIAYLNKGTILNCKTAFAVGSNCFLGGVAYVNEGTVEKCAVNVTETADAATDLSLGGVVYDNFGAINICAFKSGRELKTSSFGGISISNAVSANINFCYVKADVVTDGAGGICIGNSGSIFTCCFDGSIKAEQAGGICLTNEENATVNAVSVLGGKLEAKNVGIICKDNYGSLSSAFASINLYSDNITPTANGTNVYVDLAATAVVSDGEIPFICGVTQWINDIGNAWISIANYPVLLNIDAYAQEFPEFNDYLLSASIDGAAKITLKTETDTVLTVRKSLLLDLPVLEKQGYVFDGWTDGTNNFNGKTQFAENETATLTPTFTLMDIEFVSESGNVSKIYDGAEVKITSEFFHPLELDYVWYYSENGEDFAEAEITAADKNTYTVISVSQSGYYKCRAVFSDGVQKSEVEGSVISVSILKAAYTAANYDYGDVNYIDGGKYSGKTLKEIPLNEGFYWADETVVPTVPVSSYYAYYNSDRVNYVDFPLYINVTLEKGDYDGITYDYGGDTALYTGRYSGKRLSDVALNAGYSWKDGETVFDVGEEEYAANYNGDRDNYNDYELNIKIRTDKGIYFDITHSDFRGYVYSPDLTLADFTLADNYFWADDTVKPTVAVTEYAAFYNADSVRYEDYSLTVKIFLSQAEPTVNPIVEKTTAYIEEGMPMITLSEGDTAGTINWVTENLRLGVNDYYWRYVPHDENYLSKTGKVTLTVYDMELKSVRYETDETFKAEYKAFETFSRTGLTVYAVFTGGREIAVEKYTVIYAESRDSFRYGDEKVTISYSYDDIVKTAEVAVRVNKAEVEIPSDNSVYRYTGEPQNTVIADTELFTAVSEPQTIPGNYFATVTLRDGINYKWISSEDITVSVPWSILPKLISVPKITEKFTYNGKIQFCGIPESEYYEVLNGQGRTEAGVYYIGLRIKDITLYNWVGAEDDTEVIVEWHIDYKYVSAPKATVTSYTYTGDVIKFLYTAEGSTPDITSGINAGTYTVTFTLKDDNYRWETEPERPTRILKFTIDPISVAAPKVTTEFTYDGTEKSPYTGNDDKYTVTGNSAANAGDYTVTFTLNSSNYHWADGSPSVLRVPWKIIKSKVKIPVVGENPVYNGSEQSAPINSGALYTLENAVGTNAGNYVTMAKLKDKNNYCWADGTVDDKDLEWEILKKVIKIPTITGTYVFCAESVTAITDADEGCTVSGNVGFEAKVYTAAFELNDKVNCVWTDGTTEQKSADWVISVLRLEKPTLTRELYYNGFEQTAPLISSKFYDIENAVGKNADNYVATVKLKYAPSCVWTSGDSSDLQINWRINKAAVDKPTVTDNLLYNGAEQTIKCSLSEFYTVSGAATEAGEHTATVSLKDKENFEWTGGGSDDLNLVFHIYKINFSSDGEELSLNYTAGTPLPIPTKEGFNFAGWYLNSDFSSDRLTSLSTADGDVKLYAKWVKEDIERPADVKKSGLSVGAIIGICIAALCAVIAVIIIILSATKKNKINFRN